MCNQNILLVRSSPLFEIKMVPNRITQVRASIKVSGAPSPEAKMGRPTKKTNDVADFINQATFNYPYISGSDLHTQFDQTMLASICPTTINEFRREIGFKYLPPLHEPLFCIYEKSTIFNIYLCIFILLLII